VDDTEHQNYGDGAFNWPLFLMKIVDVARLARIVIPIDLLQWLRAAEPLVEPVARRAN
jgi:hypothetical protein